MHSPRDFFTSLRVNETWSDEGQALVRKLSGFQVWAWIFVGMNLFTLLVYLYLWSVLQRESFYLGATFLFAANLAWILPVVMAVPVSFVGASWIARAFRTMGNPSDEEEFGFEQIAFGFVFPGVSFLAPQRILGSLFDKSCRFGRVFIDPSFRTQVGIWMMLFWSGRAMDLGRLFSRLAMVDYPGYTPVAFSAMAACLFNIAFVLSTFLLFRQILEAQSPVLADPKTYEQVCQAAAMGDSFEPVQVPVPTPTREPGEDSVDPEASGQNMSRPLPSFDPQNPFRLEGRSRASWVEEAQVNPNSPYRHALSSADIAISFDGRLSRNTFVKYALAQTLICLVFRAALEFAPLLILVGWIAVVPLVLTSLALNVKRWHDHGKSGWMVLVVLIPIVGAFYSFYMLWLKEGDSDRNTYGGVERDGHLVPSESDQIEADFYNSL